MHARTVVDPQLRRQLLSAAGRHHTAAVSLDMLHELVRPSESALCAEFEPGTGPALGTDDAPPPGPVGVEPKERACLLIAAPRAPQPTATTPCCGVSPSRAPD